MLILDYQYHTPESRKANTISKVQIHGSKILEYVYCDITQSSVYF